ncbi:MAG: diguanylate cyclase [bacterium]
MSIRSKILSLLLLIALVAVGVATWLNIRSSLTGRREEIQDRVKDLGEFVGLLTKDQLLKDSPFPLEKRKLLNSWLNSKERILYLTVYNSSGKRVFQSTTKRAPPESPQLDRPFIKQALNSQSDYIVRNLTERKIFDFLVPIQLFQVHFGLVRVGFDASRFYASRNNIIRRNAIFGLLVFLVITLVGYFFTNFLVKPIRHLAEVARQFGEGHLSARADIQSGDEIEKLSNQFNTMAAQLEQRIRDLQTIEELNRKISASLRPEKLYERIVRLISSNWNIPYIALILRDPDSDGYSVASGLNINPSALNETDTPPEIIERLSSRSATDGHQSPEVNSLSALTTIFSRGEQTFSDALSIKLTAGNQESTMGYLVMARHDGTFDQSLIDLLKTLTHQIKIAVQNARNYERAVTDDLTGLYTRRFFEMELEREMESSTDSGPPLSLAMIDIDNFKDYNDTYGHPEGDRVLEQLAVEFQREVRSADIRQATRSSDTLARYGGEEFVILMPSTDLEGARKLGERIVDRVASLDSFKRQITVSIGVAEYEQDDTKQEFIQKADDALYEAKDGGKNQVVAGPVESGKS